MDLSEQPSKSEEIIQSSENISKEITEIGLPKSCLNQVIKEILTKNKIRGDKNIIPMLDSISKFYVAYLSSLGSKICLESGKKTLNIEHVIEALRRINFKNHIDLLVKDLPNGEKDPEKLKILSNVNISEDDGNIENNNLKKLINKKKKRGSRKKNTFMDENEKEAIKRMQDALYEEARQDLSLHQQSQIFSSEINENMNNIGNLSNIGNEVNTELKDSNFSKSQNINEYGKGLFFNKNEENDINFD